MHQQFVNAVNSLGIDSAPRSPSDSQRGWDCRGPCLRWPRALWWEAAGRDSQPAQSCERAGAGCLQRSGHTCAEGVVPEIKRLSGWGRAAEAVPKRILDLMNVEGLTRENVASHLQARARPHRL